MKTQRFFYRGYEVQITLTLVMWRAAIYHDSYLPAVNWTREPIIAAASTPSCSKPRTPSCRRGRSISSGRSPRSARRPDHAHGTVGVGLGLATTAVAAAARSAWRLSSRMNTAAMKGAAAVARNICTTLQPAPSIKLVVSGAMT